MANKKEVFVLLIILSVGAFARLYKIDEYMTFLGDEGRDAIVVRRLLVDFDPILIGPGTSIGNMYLGPLYYYLMAIPLFLAGYSPVGPAVMIALLGIVTIFFVWFVARLWFGKTAAVLSAALYSLSPIVIIFSKSSWNPNIMPFFALLSIFSIWQIWVKKNFVWIIVFGVSYAFVLQSHYLGLLLSPLITFFWMLAFINTKRTPGFKSFIINSFFGLFVLLFLMSPLVIFDARHDWRNFAAIKTFFTQRETTVSIKPWKSLPNLWPIFRDNYITRVYSAGNATIGKYFSLVILWTTIVYLVSNLKKIINLFLRKGEKDYFVSGFILVVFWILVVMVGMSLYKQHIYDHYFGIVFPAIFLLTGALVEKINSKFGNQGKIFTLAGFLMLLIINFVYNPIRYSPNKQLKRAEVISKVIEKESRGEPFNLAVIANQNYEDGYQYFLEKDGAKVVDIDSQVKESVKNQLFVVCEISEDLCDPTHSPKAEVANFGWSRVENQWGEMGVTVYKLIHTK